MVKDIEENIDPKDSPADAALFYECTGYKAPTNEVDFWKDFFDYENIDGEVPEEIAGGVVNEVNFVTGPGPVKEVEIYSDVGSQRTQRE